MIYGILIESIGFDSVTSLETAKILKGNIPNGKTVREVLDPNRYLIFDFSVKTIIGHNSSDPLIFFSSPKVKYPNRVRKNTFCAYSLRRGLHRLRTTTGYIDYVDHGDYVD